MHQIWTVVTVTLLSALCVDAGYYKSRPPPSAKLHYGHKPPPPGYYNKPPTPHYRRPIPIHAPPPPRNPIRPPPRPYIVKPTPPPPPPFPPASWKTHTAFRAPVVKETFHSSPLSYTPNYLHDDDKGPIHTIPAPNLSPADRPHDYHVHHGSSNSALDAVLTHGQVVQSHPASGYQVTEDPSVYKPYSGSPSYFAPDPDPSLPTIEVTKTFDPYSLPSNGVRPLDVYQQEQADQQQYQQSQYTDGSVSNSLSPQDLYSLLNQAGGGVGAWSQQPVMTPELYQQYLQAASAQGQPQQQSVSYGTNLLTGQHNPTSVGVLYHRQHQLQHDPQFSQNFRPQYETFNYNEQTRESAHGSDSFPSASSSVSVGVKRAVAKDITADSLNSVTATEYKPVRGDEDVLSNQVDYEEEEEEDKKNNVYYTTLPDKQTAETLATLSAAGNINNQIMKSPYIVGTAEQQQQQQTEEDKQQSIDEVKQTRPQSSVVEENRQTNYRTEVRNNVEDRHQYYMNQHDTTEETSSQSHQETQQSYQDNDYNNDDEILDPSDKDQRNNNMRLQNGMRVYEGRSKDETKETQQEEPNYDDTDNEYTQEQEREVSDSEAARTTVNEERVPNYNAHQKQLPFGAKLRPKRI